MTDTPAPALNSRQFPEVYRDLNVNITDLGCIMLDVEPIQVVDLVDGGKDDLYFGTDPRLKYAQGAVSETKAHVTLLFGLMESGQKWKPQVDAVLDGWGTDDVLISEVSFFPSNIPGEDYSCVIGKVLITPELLEGHQRLQLLPHIDTFPDYTPHITLAYIKNGPSGVNWANTAVEKWVQSLDYLLTGRRFAVTGINYGGEEK